LVPLLELCQYALTVLARFTLLFFCFLSLRKPLDIDCPTQRVIFVADRLVPYSFGIDSVRYVLANALFS
jgi:hypothetical protein